MLITYYGPGSEYNDKINKIISFMKLYAQVRVEARDGEERLTSM